MEIENFLIKVRECKGYTTVTGGHDVHVWTSVDMNTKTIGKECKCNSHSCGFDCERNVVVKFKIPKQNLTIFQAEMLYCIFLLKRKPHDYSEYHKCVAGKRFIENIESITMKGKR